MTYPDSDPLAHANMKPEKLGINLYLKGPQLSFCLGFLLSLVKGMHVLTGSALPKWILTWFLGYVWWKEGSRLRPFLASLPIAQIRSVSRSVARAWSPGSEVGSRVRLMKGSYE